MSCQSMQISHILITIHSLIHPYTHSLYTYSHIYTHSLYVHTHTDWAVNDRIDEIVTFQLPHYPERLRMIQLYIQQYLTQPTDGSRAIEVVDVDQKFVERLANETEGFSGREISKLGKLSV